MGQEIERVTEDGEVITGLPVGYGGNSSLAVNLARAEIDQQIATARAMPRSIKRAIDNILTLATLDAESAEECIYALPRGGKPIKGPSVRLAEIIASQWGNCRVAARVVHVDRIEKFIEAEGVFHDLETNTATTARVRRRISTKNGKVFDDDMVTVTGNAACSIAKRNAILGSVPKGVWRRAYAAVESVLAGDVKTLSERREKAMKAFAAFGVKPEQVFAALGVAGMDEIGVDHITTLMGTHSALKSGETTVEEAFPRVVAAGDRPKDLGEALDKLAGTGAVAKAEATSKPSQEAQGSRQAPASPPRAIHHEGGADASHTPAHDGGVASSFADEIEAEVARDMGDEGREQTPKDIAFDKGCSARRTGLPRRGVPRFATKSENDAWLDGWDGADAEIGGE